MAKYARQIATAERLIAKNGFSATVRGVTSETDPVTGLGGSDGSTRAVDAVQVKIDLRAFPETLTQNASHMLIFVGEVSRGEFWVDGAVDRVISEVQVLKPDNSSTIITKALIGG